MSAGHQHRSRERILAKASKNQSIARLIATLVFAVISVVAMTPFHIAAFAGAAGFFGLSDEASLFSRLFFAVLIGVPTLYADWRLLRWFAASLQEHRWSDQENAKRLRREAAWRGSRVK